MTCGNRLFRLGRHKWLGAFERTIAIAIVLLTAMRISAYAGSARPSACSSVDVATQNVYFGTDLTPIINSENESDFLSAVGTAWSQVQATDIPARATRIAQEIALASPPLVGLQEIAQWWEGQDPQDLSLQYDFLQSILSALNRWGLHYKLVSEVDELDLTVPGLDAEGNVFYVRFVDRNALLVNTSPVAGCRMSLANVQGQLFTNQLIIPVPGLGTSIPSLRSWISVDAAVGGKSFRFITTQLESFDASTQEAQAGELISGPANTSLPVVMAGDFNSSADGGPDTTPTYGDLIGAGFQDAWAQNRPLLRGDTCCQEADLQNWRSELYERIDLILTNSKAIQASGIYLIGQYPWNKTLTKPPLWPSDHAGIVASIRLGK